MTKEERNKALLDRLILARNQLDTAIENLNIRPPSYSDSVLESESPDFIGTGILLTNVGCTLAHEYTLVVFGYYNYETCRVALENARHP